MSKFYRQQLKILNDIELLENKVKDIVYKKVIQYVDDKEGLEAENISKCCELIALVIVYKYVAGLVTYRLFEARNLKADIHITSDEAMAGFNDRAMKDVIDAVKTFNVERGAVSTDATLDNIVDIFLHEFNKRYPSEYLSYNSLLNSVEELREMRK